MFLLPFVHISAACAYMWDYIIKNCLAPLALGVPSEHLIDDYKPAGLMLGATMSTITGLPPVWSSRPCDGKAKVGKNV